MFLSSYITLFLLLWSFIFFLSDGFNIDVKDTVKLQGFLDPGNYFGYSVGLAVSQNAGNQWILVGAPRSNDPSFPNVTRPGAVFACTLPSHGNSTCTKLDIDETEGFDIARFGGALVNFRHGRNDSWLGGSIDVFTSGSSDFFATCAHKWYNTYFYDLRDLIYMQGICYEVPLDLNMANVKKLPALTRDNLRVIYVTGTERTVWHYGFGGLGISVHYTKNADHLLLGATGLLDWTGGFVDLDGNQVKVMRNKINTTDIIRPYIGYSSSSGMYFSDGQTYFAIGAPREDMKGMVLFFPAGEAEYVVQNATMVLEGKENGQNLPANSYYGATLCTTDVNNDNKDDLLVGAPMYSLMRNNFFTEEPEVGMVFVYLGSKTSMGFQTPPQILKGTQVYGRFGSSIANLGDINSDSYSDVAIGAPYENDLKGAVYIYNGYTRGVWPKYSQRILASDIDTGLRGFGISIASGKDINSDNINDMVVGSYLSDQAVVMFGQPVITVDAQLNVVDIKGLVTEYIEVGKQKIERESAIICFRYVDRRCGYMKMNVTINLDVGNEQTRIVFAANNEASISSQIKMFSGDLQCSRPAEILTKSTNDLVSKIEVQADYVVQEISCPGLSVGATVSHFNGASPGDPILQIRKTLQFKNDCPNNLCRTNLTLHAEASYENVGGYFVIGNQDLNIDVVVAKTGDSSYGSVFYMAYPKYLGYKNMQKLFGEDDVTCSLIDSGGNVTGITLKETESAISCLFGNPMRNDTGVHFRLFFKVPMSFASSDTTMMMQLRVTTLSEELQPTDNNQTITINLRHNLEASFTAISTQEQIYLEERKATYNMENIYDLYNKGPSVLQSAEIKIAFPQLQNSGKAVLYLNETEIRCDYDCEAKCKFVQKQTTPTIYSYFRGRLVSKTQTPEATLSEIQNNDCRQQKCSYFVCTITSIQAKSGAVLYMQFVIDREIEGGIKEGKSVTVTSVAEVKINKTNLISNQTEFSQQVSTSVRKRTAVKEELPWWIILVSVLGGILLIVLIVLVLWKVGFFKRKKRDEMEKRKSRVPDSGNKVNNEKKRDSYTDSEGAIVDNEIPPAKNEKEKF